MWLEGIFCIYFYLSTSAVPYSIVFCFCAGGHEHEFRFLQLCFISRRVCYTSTLCCILEHIAVLLCFPGLSFAGPICLTLTLWWSCLIAYRYTRIYRAVVAIIFWLILGAVWSCDEIKKQVNIAAFTSPALKFTGRIKAASLLCNLDTAIASDWYTCLQ